MIWDIILYRFELFCAFLDRALYHIARMFFIFGSMFVPFLYIYAIVNSDIVVLVIANAVACFAGLGWLWKEMCSL